MSDLERGWLRLGVQRGVANPDPFVLQAVEDARKRALTGSDN